jgi:hypothetical protein
VGKQLEKRQTTMSNKLYRLNWACDDPNCQEIHCIVCNEFIVKAKTLTLLSRGICSILIEEQSIAIQLDIEEAESRVTDLNVESVDELISKLKGN